MVGNIGRKKMGFFSPGGWKYTFKVIPFGSTNSPASYSITMKNMKDECDGLFITKLRELSSIKGEIVSVSATMEIYIGNRNIVSGTRIIINDILLLGSNVCALCVFLKCICRVFRKYRVSFRLNKCDFLKS